MEAITEYIKRNSNGRKRPVRGATIASAFGVSGVRVRNCLLYTSPSPRDA